MEERNEKIDISPNVKIPVSKKFENFWYYYKWHTIIGIALVAVVVVLIVQLFTKPSYDVNIVYAGEKSISIPFSRERSNGTVTVFSANSTEPSSCV